VSRRSYLILRIEENKSTRLAPDEGPTKNLSNNTDELSRGNLKAVKNR
jgi:hypothetical protein